MQNGIELPKMGRGSREQNLKGMWEPEKSIILACHSHPRHFSFPLSTFRKKWKYFWSKTDALGKKYKGEKRRAKQLGRPGRSLGFPKIHFLLFVVANDPMVQPLSFSVNKTKGTGALLGRHLFQPLGVGLFVLVIAMVHGPRPSLPHPCT